ncbi:hypothetical protein AVEN_119949-1, partial [Araneus ventricosus]
GRSGLVAKPELQVERVACSEPESTKDSPPVLNRLGLNVLSLVCCGILKKGIPA